VSFGELLGAVFGWVATLVEWLIGWVPVYRIVRSDEVAVAQTLGREPREWEPGTHWYVPNLTEVTMMHTSRMVLAVDDISLETSDGVPCQIGLTMSYHITDPVTYRTENYEAEDGLAEMAEAALRDAVMERTWDRLKESTEDGKKLEKMLSTRLQRSLERFGIEVESCRPTDQVRIERAVRVFGTLVQSNLTMENTDAD